jgi:hypothetical protein
MDELNEYLAKTKIENKLGELKMHMNMLIDILCEARITPELEKVCDQFLDDFYDIITDKGVDL